jgi:hypothetical protein
MFKVLPATLFVLSAAASTLGETGENLILNRPYAYWPHPEFHDCKDDADTTQRTDEVTKYTGGMWMFPITVGWAEGVDVLVIIHFDLGDEATVDELVFNSCGGGGAGVVQIGLRVYVSLE